MKKLLLLLTALLVAAGGAYAFKTEDQLADRIATAWNVQAVTQSATVDDQFMVEVAWKDLTQGPEAAAQMCLFFPVDTILWEDKLGEPHVHYCK